MKTNAFGELIHDQIDPHHEMLCDQLQQELEEGDEVKEEQPKKDVAGAEVKGTEPDIKKGGWIW